MGLGIHASAVVEGQYVFHFYDNDGQLVKTVETAVSSGTPTNCITKTELNLMPDFIDDGETVVITWKLKGGADEPYDLLQHLGSSNPLTADVELEPLRTMPTEELFSIAAIDCHADTTQAVINDGSNDWLPKSFNDLGVAPDNPPAKHPGDFSDVYGGRFPVEQVAPRDYGGQMLFPYMKQGGQAGALFTAFTGAYGLQDTSRGSGDLANSKALAMIYALHLSQANNSDDVALVTDVEGFQEAFDSGKLGIMQFVESAYCLTPENYYELLEQYYDLGIRGLSFTWNSGTQAYGTSTAFATALGSTVYGYAFTNTESPVARANTSGSVWGSAWPEITDGVGTEIKSAKDLSDDGQVGLTALGEKALARMYELGMFFDGVHQREISDFQKLKHEAENFFRAGIFLQTFCVPAAGAGVGGKKKRSRSSPRERFFFSEMRKNQRMMTFLSSIAGSHIFPSSMMKSAGPFAGTGMTFSTSRVRRFSFFTAPGVPFAAQSEKYR